MNCHESGCKSGFPNYLQGKDDPKYGENENLCKNTFKIPKWAVDGQYTIQWAWLGGSSYYNDKNRGQQTYQNCMDFTVKGGSAPEAKPSTVCPLFKGGDPFNPAGDKCFTFVTNGNSEPTMKSCFPDGCYGKLVSVAPQAAANCGLNTDPVVNTEETVAKVNSIPAALPSSSTPSQCMYNPEYQKYLEQNKY
jgi:hypothetical protein